MSREADFLQQVKEMLQKRAAYICSNPNCRVLTLSPSETDIDKIIYIGEAAHITAASPQGPRYNKQLTTAERASIDNAIFLCSNCADMIDKNKGIDFDVEQLKKWKSDHDIWVRTNLNKSMIGQAQTEVTVYQNIDRIVKAGMYVENYNGSSTVSPQDRRRLYDESIFEQLNVMMSRDNLLVIIEKVLSEHSISSRQTSIIGKFIHYAASEDYYFLDDCLQESMQNLLNQLKILQRFIALNFFIFPKDKDEYDGSQYCLHPRLNVDREGTGELEEITHYDEYSEELEQKVIAVKESYAAFRQLYRDFQKS